ncbi:hypothetical protein Tco_0876716 [Tanacetum coccineum]|uniref:Uncharacterized protein n=1 Tax=Tanacetum coccineum TaxID=301880 RepID=A0ABQ5BT31_9ASTR
MESRVESLEKENLCDTKQTLETAVPKVLKKVKKLEIKLRQREKSRGTKVEEDAEGQDQDIPSATDQGKYLLLLKEQEGTKSTPTPTKILEFEEPAEAQVNTGSTPSAQVNTAEVNTAEVNTAEVNTAELNTGETERVQRRKGKDPMTEEDLQAEDQASKKSKELQELAGLEAAQRLQATMDAETQRQIDLDALLARRLVEQEEEAAKEALATEFDYIQARLNADQILAEKIQQEEREQYSILGKMMEQRKQASKKTPTISQLRNQMITYLKHVANKKHAELKSKSFEEIQVLYERYKKQDQTFVAIGSEEDERAIKRMNEQAADKEKEQKDESVHEEVKEEEGAKKRKLGTRRKLKAKRRKYTSSLTREDDDLKMCLHIAPDEDKVVDVEILDHQYPIVEWQSFFLTTKPQFDPTKPLEDDYMNRVTRSNGNMRFFRTLMGVLSIFDREDLKAVYELVMEEYQDEIPEGFDKMLWGDLMIMFNQGDTADFWDKQLNWKLISWKLHSSSGVHTIMTSNGLVIHMLVENRYPLTKEVLSQMLDLKLETEEESTMALELIKFVKQQLEEFEDSNDDDLATSDHEEAERDYQSFKAHLDPVYKDLHKRLKIVEGSEQQSEGNKDVKEKDSDDHDKIINLQRWVVLREVYQIFRVGQAPKAYPYFEAMLKEFDRDDMPLKVMFEPVATDGLWQFEAPIKSWRLYKSCRVHCLIIEGMIIYMLDDIEYPLPKTTLQKMLDLKCEVSEFDDDLIQMINLI